MDNDDALPVAPSAHIEPGLLASGGRKCSCIAETRSPSTAFVYAIGKVEARFPSLSIEKEFVQLTGRHDTAGLTDQQVFASILSQPECRYIARQLCWVLTIREMDTYLLHPRDPGDLDLLVNAIRPEPGPLDLDVVIGMRGPLAPPEMCNGLILPIVAFEQIYSFDRDSFVNSIPKMSEQSDEQHTTAARQVLDAILRGSDNAGYTAEHRALNYLLMRYSDIYAETVERFAADFSLSGVEVRNSPLGGARTVMTCIFIYTNRKTAFTEKLMASVDVTEKFPFLTGKLAPYFDRAGT